MPKIIIYNEDNPLPRGKAEAYLRAAVKRGIKLLDKAQPDWAQKIDLKDLDLGSVSYCMLGQLYEDYSDGKEALRTALSDVRSIALKLTTNGELQATLYGFDTPPIDDRDLDSRYTYGYSVLTELWTEVIKSRRRTEVRIEEQRRSNASRS